MSERGVFAVDRGIFDHPVLSSREPFSRREAWLWIVAEAAWKPRTFRSNGQQIMLARGQLSHSVRFLADKWGWSKSAVARFLDVLQTETMIEKVAGTGQIIITVCNFDSYQRVSLPSGTDAGTPIGTGAGQQRDKEEDIKGNESNSFIQGGELFELEEVAQPKARKHEWPRDYRERFWTAYPLKVGKKTALEVLERLHAADGTAFDDILAGIETYKRTKPPDRDWMHATTFLRQERWNDEPASETRQPNSNRASHNRGGEAILAGVRAVTDRITGRHAESPDVADRFDADGQREAGHNPSDLELPYRVV